MPIVMSKSTVKSGKYKKLVLQKGKTADLKC